jgi:succinate dehydrogenase / fumarate reductase cytochrome b subunit
MTDARYRFWRRLHVFTGVVPVGLFLIVHIATNAVAIAGPGAYNQLAERLESLPQVRTIEALAIAAPLLAHIALGIALGNTAQAVESAGRYPRPGMQTLQRATGFWLVVYGCFHVWGTRLSAERLAHGGDFFALMSGQLGHPGTVMFYVSGVVAASVHFGLGLASAGAWWRIDRPPAISSGVRRASVGLAIALGLAGINAVLAFVHPAARWLER